MHPESEKRAAQLAVSRYGAEAARVQRLYQQVLQVRAKGQAADLLDLLVQTKLLTSVQAQELRSGLDQTHVDTNRKPDAKTNGALPVPAPTNGTELQPFDHRQLGDYRILRRLGEGGMGSVYLGYNEAENRYVALKVLPDHMAGNQVALDRFYREAKSGALLNHPNIVRNLAAGRDQTTAKHYLVMEFVDGPSALDLLQRQGRLPVGDAVHITLDIARALEHAHSRNIVHRDIKPDNILLTQAGIAKLSDLGLAKRTDETSHLTAARQGFGTPYYMPYEQAMNAKYADGRSDIYALGATFYHLIAGEVPFPGANHLEIVDKKNLGAFPAASSHNPDIPPVLDDILTRMLARDPADRYQTISEFIVELERTNLSPAVPTFADADLAMQDPVMRERLLSPAQMTAPDLQLKPGSEIRKTNPDIWYLRYRDPTGRWCKVKATTEQVLHRLRERRFPADVEASHHHKGEFQPLASFDEFAAVIADSGKKKRRASDKAKEQPSDAASKQKSAPPARRWWFFGVVVAGMVLAGSAVVGKLLW